MSNLNGNLQRINWRVAQLERNNRKLRSKIIKLEKINLELIEQNGRNNK